MADHQGFVAIAKLKSSKAVTLSALVHTLTAPESAMWVSSNVKSPTASAVALASEPFMRDVLGRTWKGNARQLRSYLEQAVALSDQGVIDLPPGEYERPGLHSEHRDESNVFIPLQAMVEEAERRHIQRALERADGSVSGTADLLGISRKTLWEKMKRLKIRAAEVEPSGVSANGKN